MRIAAVLVLILSLVSCDTRKRAADGYYFEAATFNKRAIAVNVVLLGSRAAVAAEYERKAAQGVPTSTPATGKLAAFSTLRQDGCTIYMVDPAVDYQPEFIGHELVHCFYGEWHGAQ